MQGSGAQSALGVVPGRAGPGERGALGVGSPVAPGGRTRQNTRMLPFRSCTSLYSRRFSSSVPLYLAATLLSSSTCARASGLVAKPNLFYLNLVPMHTTNIGTIALGVWGLPTVCL